MSDLLDIEPVNRDKLQPLSAPMDWLPTGPVLRSYVLAPEPVTAVMGPYGSGKTIGSFIKGLMCSCVVPRSPIDGVRYARGLVVRDTYRNLEMNTIPSWQERFPPELGTFKGGGGGEPGKAVIDFELTQGEILHLEVLFAALGDHNVKQFCDGFQATWCFANGADALPREFIPYMRPRLGRWPPPQHRPADWRDHVHRWRKLFLDFNAPDIDNWIYGAAEKKHPGFVEFVPPGWKLFIQPSGMDPMAENRENLPPDYYEALAQGNEAWWVNRFVHNKFGYSRAGEPVYPEWNDALHVAQKPLVFEPRRKLILGMDAGRDPCAIAMQRTFMGCLNVLAEFVPQERMGAKRFGEALSQWLADNFPDADIAAYADPSAANPTQDSEDESVWIETVAAVAKIKIRSAPTNALGPRLEAVRDKLNEMIDGAPGFQLDPKRCPILRRGFNSGYKFATREDRPDERPADVPLKNKFSHPHDGCQYGALGSSDYRELKGRESRKGRTIEETTWDPHA